MAFFRIKKLSEDEKEYYGEFEEKEQELIVLIKEDCGGAAIRGDFMSPSVRFIASINPKTNELSHEEGVLSWLIPRNHNNNWGYEFKKMNVYKVRVRKRHKKELKVYQSDIVNRKYLVMKILEHLKSEPRLEAIKEEYLKPVYIDDKELGKFTLNRKYSWFEGNIAWLGHSTNVELEIDRDNGSTAKIAFERFQNFASDIIGWDEKIRSYAAEELTELANDWNDDEETDETISKEEFANRIRISSINIHSDGSSEFTFNDDDMFFGHWVVVYIDEQGNFKRADMEG